MTDFNGPSKRYLLVSDFDQTLSFHDSGHVLAEMVGISDFGHRGPAGPDLAELLQWYLCGVRCGLHAVHFTARGPSPGRPAGRVLARRTAGPGARHPTFVGS